MLKNAENLSSYFVAANAPHPAIAVLFLFAANYFRFQILFLSFASKPIIYCALIASVAAIFLYETAEKKKVRVASIAYTQPGVFLSISSFSVIFALFIQLTMMFYLLSSFLEGSLHVESFGLLLGIVVVSGFASVVGGNSWMTRLCAMLGIIIVGGVLFSALSVGREGAAGFNQQAASNIQAGDMFQWIGGCIGLPLVSLWMWRIDTAILPHYSKSLFVPSIAVAALLIAFSVWRDIPLLFNSGWAEQKSAGVIAAVAIAAAGIAGTSWNISSMFAFRILGRKMSESKKALMGRLTAAGVVIVSIAFIQIVKAVTAEIVPLYVTALACFVPPMVAPFVLRALVARESVHSVRWSLLGGEIFAIVCFIALRAGMINDPFMAGSVIFTATLAIYGVGSVVSARAAHKEVPASSSAVSAKSLYIQ